MNSVRLCGGSAATTATLAMNTTFTRHSLRPQPMTRTDGSPAARSLRPADPGGPVGWRGSRRLGCEPIPSPNPLIAATAIRAATHPHHGEADRARGRGRRCVSSPDPIDAHTRRYTGDPRSPKPFGRITPDTRVILAEFFGLICGDDHPCITRSARAAAQTA